MEIQTIRKGCNFELLEKDSKLLKPNSNHSKGIRSIRMQIQIIRKKLDFESKFETFERDSNHSNANSNNSKEIQRIGMQIRSIRK